MNNSGLIVLLTILMVISACAQTEMQRKPEDKKGIASSILGRTSSGEPISGRAWFYRGAPFGNYYVQVGENTICKGRYPTKPSVPLIDVGFSCNDGRSGVMKIQRTLVSKYNLMKAIQGSVVLSDGTSANIKFGEKFNFCTGESCARANR